MAPARWEVRVWGRTCVGVGRGVAGVGVSVEGEEEEAQKNPTPKFPPYVGPETAVPSTIDTPEWFVSQII